MEKAVLAAMAAASSDVNLMTNDRLEALTKGHGMLNLAVWSIANIITEELSRGSDISLSFSNTRTLPLDDVIAKTVAAAKEAGADSANAALLSAAMLYLAGTPSQAGVPVGNRKLGALCRMAAGADRCGVAAIPTAKTCNKLSGFAAVQAIYEAMVKGELTKVDGRKIPRGVTNVFVGHAPLGEENSIPEVARNAAAIGTKAMMDAQAGLGIRPEPLYAAIFGAAATLEILHPDAWISSPDTGVTENSSYAVGKSAVQTAELPPQLRLQVTGEVYDTAKFVADMGLILKDIGAPTVVGMLCLRDVLMIFREAASLYRRTTPPMGHSSAEAVLAMKAMIAWNFDGDRVREAITRLMEEQKVDPEVAHIALNTVARKAEQVRSGPITTLLIKATDPVRTNGLYRRALQAYQGLLAGKDLAEVVRELEMERVTGVAHRSSAVFSQAMGKEVVIQVTKIGPRHSKKDVRGNFWALDMDVDVDVTVDGKKTELVGLVHKCLPQIVLEDDTTLAPLIMPACLPISELAVSAHTIINVTIPAAVAAAMGKVEPAEAAEITEQAAYVTAGIPGAREKAAEVASRAVLIAKALPDN